MAKEKWLSSIAKSGEYKDLINKPIIETSVDSQSEINYASAKSVKLAHDKALSAINLANSSKEKISNSLKTMGVDANKDESFDSLANKITTIKTGVNTDDASATSNDLMVGKTAYARGEKITGSIENLSANSPITHEKDNLTKVIKSDGLFIGNNTDGVRRVSLRYNGSNGYITGNTLFGLPEVDVANSLGITSNKILKGHSICGVNGTATLIDANNGSNKIAINGLIYDGDYLAGTVDSNNSDIILIDEICGGEGFYYIMRHSTSSGRGKYKIYIDAYTKSGEYVTSYTKSDTTTAFYASYMHYSKKYKALVSYSSVTSNQRLTAVYEKGERSLSSVKMNTPTYSIAVLGVGGDFTILKSNGSMYVYDFRRISAASEISHSYSQKLNSFEDTCFKISDNNFFFRGTKSGLYRYKMDTEKIYDETETKILSESVFSTNKMVIIDNILVLFVNNNYATIVTNCESDNPSISNCNIPFYPDSIYVNKENGNYFLYGQKHNNDGSIFKVNINNGHVVFNLNISSIDHYNTNKRVGLHVESDLSVVASGYPLGTHPKNIGIYKLKQYINLDKANNL